ncbi:hypothetical protein Fmac_005165 [Flemingia macrophylla]|uniref:Uncharacterized protein n=1 Tax=Flemingia macrophylla TaxID=520843 RepID=A0ABD1N9L4_9FABA
MNSVNDVMHSYYEWEEAEARVRRNKWGNGNREEKRRVRESYPIKTHATSYRGT